jgi:hypothetical protein
MMPLGYDAPMQLRGVTDVEPPRKLVHFLGWEGAKVMHANAAVKFENGDVKPIASWSPVSRQPLGCALAFGGIRP